MPDNSENSGKLPLPLEGIRVLDVTHIVAGPFCSVVLADMGAEVIKVERPVTGERGRANGPFVEGPDGARSSARFLGINRNKKSISLDLRDPRCKAALLNMVRVSDVLLDNFGPGALERLGLGYQELKQVNPGIIYASITVLNALCLVALVWSNVSCPAGAGLTIEHCVIIFFRKLYSKD